jgi:hypothetical protein
MRLTPIPAEEIEAPVPSQEFQQAMPPAEDITTDVVATTDQIAPRLLDLVGHVDGGELARAIEVDERGRVAPVRLDPPPRAPRRQGRRDHVARYPERAELAVQVIPRSAGFVARGHRPLVLEPCDQAADVLRVIRNLPQLRCGIGGPQDPGDDLPLAVVQRHVGSILLHDRPPFACGSVPARNNPRLCNRSGRSFHIV